MKIDQGHGLGLLTLQHASNDVDYPKQFCLYVYCVLWYSRVYLNLNFVL